MSIRAILVATIGALLLFTINVVLSIAIIEFSVLKSERSFTLNRRDP